MMIRFLILFLSCAGAFAQANFPVVLGSAQELVDFTPGNVKVAVLTNGLGAFRWDAASTATTNTATVFASTKKAGRWLSFPFGTVDGDASSKIDINGGEANSLTINSATIAGTITAASTNVSPTEFAYLKGLAARVALLAAQSSLDAATSSIAANTAAIALKANQSDLASVSNSVLGKIDGLNGNATNLYVWEAARRALYLDANNKVTTLDDVVMADLYVTANTGADLSSSIATMEGNGKTNVIIQLGMGTYRFTRQFTNINVTILGAGRNATFIEAATTNAHILIFDKTNHIVQLRDLTINGRSISKSGIASQHGKSLVLKNVAVLNCGTNGTANPIDGVAVTSPWMKFEAYDCWFENNERDGAFLFPVEYGVFERCVSTNNGRGGFVSDLGADTTFYDNIGGKRTIYKDSRSAGNGAIGFHFESYDNYPMLGIIENCTSADDGGRDSVWGYSYGVAFGRGTYGWMDNTTVTNFMGTAATYGQAVLCYANSAPVWIQNSKIITNRFNAIESNQLTPMPVYIKGNEIRGAGRRGIQIYLGAESEISGNTISGSTNENVWINTAPRIRMANNVLLNPSQGTNNALANIYIAASLGFLIEGNHVNGSSGKYAVEWDSSSRNLSTWRNNRISGFGTLWASDAGNTTDGDLDHGRRVYSRTGAADPTLDSPLANDLVQNLTDSVTAPAGWFYAGSAWQAMQPKGNSYSFYGRTNWGGTYNHEYSVDNANAAIWRRNNTASNELSVVLGSLAETLSGAGIIYRTNGVPLGMLLFSPQGMLVGDGAFTSSGFFDNQNRRLGIKTLTPAETLDVNGIGIIRSNLNVGGIGFYADIAGDPSSLTNGQIWNNGGAIKARISGSTVTLGAGGGSSSLYLNGASVTNPNLADSSTAILRAAATTNISVYPTNLADAQISASAAIARSKIATGTANHVVINDGSGNLSSEANLAVSRGGTGASTAAGALDSLITAEATVASATTTDLGAVTSRNVQITGTTTITGFGTVAAGVMRWGRFSGALTLTHNATSLILPGAANITTAANDRFSAISLGSGNWLVYFYQQANGAITPGGNILPTATTTYNLGSTAKVWANIYGETHYVASGGVLNFVNDVIMQRRATARARMGDNSAGPGTLESAGMWHQTVSKSANYTTTVQDYTIRVDASGGARTITLLDPASAYDSGYAAAVYVVKKTDSSGNAVTVQVSGGANIDGSATVTISSQYAGKVFQSNGTTYDIIGSF